MADEWRVCPAPGGAYYFHVPTGDVAWALPAGIDASTVRIPAVDAALVVDADEAAHTVLQAIVAELPDVPTSAALLPGAAAAAAVPAFNVAAVAVPAAWKHAEEVFPGQCRPDTLQALGSARLRLQNGLNGGYCPLERHQGRWVQRRLASIGGAGSSSASSVPDGDVYFIHTRTREQLWTAPVGFMDEATAADATPVIEALAEDDMLADVVRLLGLRGASAHAASLLISPPPAVAASARDDDDDGTIGTGIDGTPLHVALARLQTLMRTGGDAASWCPVLLEGGVDDSVLALLGRLVLAGAVPPSAVAAVAAGADAAAAAVACSGDGTRLQLPPATHQLCAKLLLRMGRHVHARALTQLVDGSLLLHSGAGGGDGGSRDSLRLAVGACVSGFRTALFARGAAAAAVAALPLGPAPGLPLPDVSVDMLAPPPPPPPPPPPLFGVVQTSPAPAAADLHCRSDSDSTSTASTSVSTPHDDHHRHHQHHHRHAHGDDHDGEAGPDAAAAVLWLDLLATLVMAVTSGAAPVPVTEESLPWADLPALLVALVTDAFAWTPVAAGSASADGGGATASASSAGSGVGFAASRGPPHGIVKALAAALAALQRCFEVCVLGGECGGFETLAHAMASSASSSSSTFPPLEAFGVITPVTDALAACHRLQGAAGAAPSGADGAAVAPAAPAASVIVSSICSQLIGVAASTPHGTCADSGAATDVDAADAVPCPLFASATAAPGGSAGGDGAAAIGAAAAGSADGAAATADALAATTGGRGGWPGKPHHNRRVVVAALSTLTALLDHPLLAAASDAADAAGAPATPHFVLFSSDLRVLVDAALRELQDLGAPDCLRVAWLRLLVAVVRRTQWAAAGGRADNGAGADHHHHHHHHHHRHGQPHHGLHHHHDVDDHHELVRSITSPSSSSSSSVSAGGGYRGADLLAAATGLCNDAAVAALALPPPVVRQARVVLVECAEQLRA